MKHAFLVRRETDDMGTRGTLILRDETDTIVFSCRTLELPHRGNKPGKSCVPAGVYGFKWRKDSPKHGEVYEEWDDPATPQKEDVPGRENVQIHAANLAGDVDKGYVSQLLGCIAPGGEFAVFKAGRPPAGDKDQLGITDSRRVLGLLQAELGRLPFVMHISWAAGVGPKEA